MNLKGKLELIDAIYEATTSLQFVEYSKKYLLEKGFVELKENEKWGDIPSKYFVTRNDKSLIVVNGTEKSKGLIICSEISTPCLQAKPNCFDTHNGYNGVRCAYSEYYHSYNPSNSLLCTSGQIFYHENEDGDTEVVELTFDVNDFESLDLRNGNNRGHRYYINNQEVPLTDEDKNTNQDRPVDVILTLEKE